MNPTRILPHLQCSLVCDQVRQEANGSLIIMGVINVLRVPQMPVIASRICLLNRWTSGLGDFRETSRMIAPDQTTVLAQSELKFQLRDPAHSSMAVNIFTQVTFETAGTYFVEVLVEDVLKIRYPLMVVHVPQGAPQPQPAGV